MIDNPSSGGAGHNVPILTVSELSQSLKRTVEDSFGFVRVRGEISGVKRAASGHIYFTIKDANSVLDGVCWRGAAGRLGLQPEDGMEVVAGGRLTTFPGRSKYQIVVSTMELAGEGALLKLLEERRKKLAAEGLFNEDRKKKLPFLPEVIGVVTSPTGAVIRDILHRLADRFGRRVLLWPVLVQGKEAAGQVAAAIEGFNRIEPGGEVPRPDVLIVARGGGSLEDLWAFNEEAVVRAVAESRIPVISAIGHETDTTLIDHAADRRAPTPTAAAEIAVPVRMELLAQVLEDSMRMAGAVNRMMADRRTRVHDLARGLPNLRRVTEEAAQRLDDRTERLNNCLKVGLERRRAIVSELAAKMPDLRQRIAHVGSRLDNEVRAMKAAMSVRLREIKTRFGHAAALLESCSYQRVLERGFALVRDDSQRPVMSAAALAPGTGVTIRFHDGDTAAIINGKQGPGHRPSPKSKGRSKPPPDDGSQGKLL